MKYGVCGNHEIAGAAAEAGYEVTLVEKEARLGGFAAGCKELFSGTGLQPVPP